MRDVRAASPQFTRWSWAGAGGAAFALLVIARVLVPDPSGLGTHVQLGLPPCAFLQVTQLPCPTCGLTTSFAYMAHLQFTPAFHAHWLGPPLFVLTAVTVGVCAWGSATRMPIAPTMIRLRVVRVLAIIAAAALIVWVARIAAILLA
jgi:hypothetical protein